MQENKNKNVLTFILKIKERENDEIKTIDRVVIFSNTDRISYFNKKIKKIKKISFSIKFRIKKLINE